MQRNRRACGVNHLGIQKRLLAEKDLTFDKALNIAKPLEAAEKDTQDLKSDTAVSRRSFTSTHILFFIKTQKTHNSKANIKSISNNVRFTVKIKWCRR